MLYRYRYQCYCKMMKVFNSSIHRNPRLDSWGGTKANKTIQSRSASSLQWFMSVMHYLSTVQYSKIAPPPRDLTVANGLESIVNGFDTLLFDYIWTTKITSPSLYHLIRYCSITLARKGYILYSVRITVTSRRMGAILISRLSLIAERYKLLKVCVRGGKVTGKHVKMNEKIKARPRWSDRYMIRSQHGSRSFIKYLE